MFDKLGFNPATLMATAALGPAGGISMQLANRIFAEMGTMLLQNAGERLGLPQMEISQSIGEFNRHVGERAGPQMSLREGLEQLGERSGSTPAQIGEQERQTLDFINNTLKRALDDSEQQSANGGRGGGKNGWLMAMAKALGAQLDQLGAEMTSMAKRITKDTPGLSAEFSVVTQQFSMLMNATTNAIKTVGEAMGKAASKN